MRDLALIRGIPETFARATARIASREPIDVRLARAQHRAYADALLALGLALLELPPVHELPDSCFVEDCALVADSVALISVLGERSRRPEAASVERALEPYARIERMHLPATLDGGDCLRLGPRIYIGRSARTNDAGIARAREVFGPRGIEVIAVPLPEGALHLKEVASPISDDLVAVAEGTISPGIFGTARAVMVPGPERYAANALAVGRTVLLPAGFQRTRALIEAHGFRVVTLDMSEFQKGDGSMTCCSILL